MERKIKSVESTSIGKIIGGPKGKNDDAIYVGENFAAVFDGVSRKSSIMHEGREVKVAEVIAEALGKIDKDTAPEYAKKLTFEEFTQYINMYIKKYYEKLGISPEETPLEATGVIYSKYYNQIWLVGDCRAIYDGHPVTNVLKADELYTDIRRNIIEILLEQGYTQEDLLKKDISRDIIQNQELIQQYISDANKAEELKDFINNKMHEALTTAGFSEEEIEEQHLMERYNEPRKLQQYAKNNPNAGEYGYAVFNGIYTELKNCVVTQLPDNVKTIKMSSDGFPLETLKKDLGHAIRANRKLTEGDILSIDKNRGTHSAVLQCKGKNYRTVDDSSAVIIEIIQEQEQEKEEYEGDQK